MSSSTTTINRQQQQWMAEMTLAMPNFQEDFRNEITAFLQTHNPDLLLLRSKEKNVRFFCELDRTPKKTSTYISLGQIFPLWMKGVHASSVVREKSVLTPFIALMCFNTPRGELFIAVQTKKSATRRMIYLMGTGKKDTTAACIKVSAGEEEEEGGDCPELVAITAFNPYQCSSCCSSTRKEEKLHKCSRCWSALGLSVRYCSRACQLAHFPVHRLVCGKKEEELSGGGETGSRLLLCTRV